MRSPITAFLLITLGCSTILAALIWSGQGMDPLLSWLLSINLVTFLAYGYDKKIAGTGRMRVPERVLLLLALAGGSPAAWLGMRAFNRQAELYHAVLVDRPHSGNPGWCIFCIDYLRICAKLDRQQANLAASKPLEVAMIHLLNKKTGAIIAEITEKQLQFLEDQLEEESLEDQDYAITSMTLDYFVELNADPLLVDLLRAALGDKDELVILWKRD